VSTYKTGTILDGKYEVTRALASGGFGEVVLVRHLHLEELRVIKILRPEQAADPAAAQRFLRTARMATQIKHPNVAILHDYAQLPDSRFYMVWEYVEGQELGHHVEQQGPLSLGLAVELGIQTLRGLEAIHTAGIIHRDISPDNLLLSRDPNGKPRIKVIDLGLAKSLNPTRDDKLTDSGMFMGKLRYCSPEQAGLDGEVPLDRRTDLYSFATVLYEAICGRPPFETDSPHGAVFLRLSEDPLPLTGRVPGIEVPLNLDRAVMRGLARDREQRYPSAVAFIQALERARDDLRAPATTANDAGEDVEDESFDALTTQRMEAFRDGEASHEAPAAHPPSQPPSRAMETETLLDEHLDAHRLPHAKLAFEALLELVPNHPLRRDYKRRLKALEGDLQKETRAREVLAAGRQALTRGDLSAAQRKLEALGKADPTGELSETFAREVARSERQVAQSTQLGELTERFDRLLDRGFLTEAEARLREIADLQVSKVSLDRLRERLTEARQRHRAVDVATRFEESFRQQLDARNWSAARQVAIEMGRTLPDNDRSSEMLTEISNLQARQQRHEAVEHGAKEVERLLAAGQPEQARQALDILQKMAPDHPRSKALASRFSG
jgi:serine/threonine-protein kinase